jgi:hypothetical protein
MNNALILKEMGISSWKLRDGTSSSDNKSLQPQLSNKTMNSNFPVWTLVIDQKPSTLVILKNIQKVIHNFGVETQVLTDDPSALTKSSIRGHLLLALGDLAGRHFSGENAPTSELREILFETINDQDQEIPVIVTHSLEGILGDTKKKKDFWVDLIFARNVFLDTMA